MKAYVKKVMAYEREPVVEGPSLVLETETETEAETETETEREGGRDGVSE